MSCRIVVLISGSGRNLQALIDANHADSKIVGVVSNTADAFGLQRAQNAGIASQVLSHRDFDSREAFDQQLAAVIDQFQPDLVVLAGFMRILTPTFVGHYQGRMLNIHPSLLPKYQGLNTHQRALDANDVAHGASVHFVSAELDGGPVVIQGQVPVLANDTASTLADRVMQVEQRIYPQAVAWFAEGRLQQRDGQIILNNQALTSAAVINYEDLESSQP